MRVGYKTDLPSAVDYIDRAGRQVPYATALALSRTAAAIGEAITADIARVFDRPTPYTMSAVRVIRARKESLSARVDFKDASGKGISADRYLWPQVFGGERGLKRSEKALARIGLPTGSYAIPAAGAEMDVYGNMSRGQIVRLLSYLQAFGEQGYRANSTTKSRARMAKVGTSQDGYRRINGVVYFVSRGRGSMSGNRRQTLPAGIWAKTGTHGVDVKPVLIATKQVEYRPLLEFYETADRVANERFEVEYASALDLALATAK
ncbi:MAG: hypothetical protein E2576_14335 [Alcaligenaceae bacterium]|nr:hypothetical protein [Alcaligenaceae bacterium SAGV5]MPS50442.1 hypothetical protein [Alcaligenaceae bacterium SAGV3]MPT57897.1 hypothetical protein [Alcaligenaceae bacterium]